MTLSPKIIRISLALLVSLSFIAAGYYFSSPLRTSIANATSTEELLKAYAAKDTDSDGLPDWQESLYGTDLTNPHSVDPKLTDKEAVDQGKVEPKFKSDTQSIATPAADDSFGGAPSAAPGSLTEQFSRAFLESYLSAGGGQVLNQDDQQKLIENLLKVFTTKASALVASEYSLSSVRTSPDTTIDTYSDVLYQALTVHEVPQGQGDPVALMQAFLEDNDESARAPLEGLAQSYAAIAKDLARMPVPIENKEDHLLLLQSFDTLSKATLLVVSYERDPIATLGSLAIYQPASKNIVVALKGIATTILKNGEPAPGTVEAFLVNASRLSDTPQ